MKNIFVLFIFMFFIKCDVLPSNSVYKPNSSTGSSNSSGNENKEFADLLAKDQINKKEVSAKILTYLLNDTNPKDPQTVIVIENASNCNIIVRLVATKNNQIYNLPISKNDKNQFIINKGNYTLKSNVCVAKYYSQKNISEPLILKLSAH